MSQGVLRRTNLAPGVIASGFTDHFTGYGTSTTARTSPYGHVAVVTGVNPDGTFNVQEAGYGGTFPWEMLEQILVQKMLYSYSQIKKYNTRYISSIVFLDNCQLI
ncbi:hypothetical protein OBG91_11770 [Lactococcus lactis]|nr:hypothetical protein [Lactococcus lactis]